MSGLPCNCRCQQQFHSHSQPVVAAHTQINGWEGTRTQASTRVSELPCSCRCQQQFHSHSQPFAAAHTQINGWEGTCMQALVTLTMLLYNSTVQARGRCGSNPACEECLLFLHADPHGLGKQDRAEELFKDQKCAMSEDSIDPFEV